MQSKSKEKLIVMSDRISAEVATAALSATSTVDAGKSLPIYDERGTIVGYVALYANAGLTA